MSLAHDVAKLMAARQARADHAARIAAQPIDQVTKYARLASILTHIETTPRDQLTPRELRLLEIFDKARARRDHQGIA